MAEPTSGANRRAVTTAPAALAASMANSSTCTSWRPKDDVGCGEHRLVGPGGSAPAPAVDLGARAHHDALERVALHGGAEGVEAAALVQRAGERRSDAGVGLVDAEVDDHGGVEVAHQLHDPLPLPGVDAVEVDLLVHPTAGRVDVDADDGLDVGLGGQVVGDPHAHLAAHPGHEGSSAQRSLLGSEGGEQHHVPDRRHVGQQHDQSVDPDAEAAGGGQAVLEGAEVVLVDRHGLVVAGVPWPRPGPRRWRAARRGPAAR